MNNSKKKILIATFIYTNYGGILQAYALQSYLSQYNNLEVTNLNFRTKEHENESSLFYLYGSFKSRIGQLIFILLRCRGLYMRIKRTKEFKKRYFKFTKLYRTENEFLECPPFADIYISGSDQVFNPEGKYKNVFYLSFPKGNSRKVSYAASFGIRDLSALNNSIYKTLLNDFDSLSFREQDSAKLINVLLNKNSNWVLDPTFLLTQDEWKKVCVQPLIKEKYIYVYALAEEEVLLKIAKKIQAETGYKIIFTRNNTRNFLKADKFIYGAGPSEFLGLIMDAEYVVTDSFHGLVFSVIFKRQFYVYISRPDYSVRIMNLIELVNGMEYLFDESNISGFKFSRDKSSLNFVKLDEMVKKSKQFINNEIINE